MVGGLIRSIRAKHGDVWWDTEVLHGRSARRLRVSTMLQWRRLSGGGNEQGGILIWDGSG